MIEQVLTASIYNHTDEGLSMLKKQAREAEDARRREITERFQKFLEAEGRLPEGFSEPYNRISASGQFVRETPFEAYLDTIWKQVDSLRDETGISDWLFLDETADINAAALSIAAWANRHKEETRLLREKCHIGNTTIMLPVSPYCTEKVMVVIKDGQAFRGMTTQSLQACQEENISFCTVLSDRKLYDLAEQKEKEIQYITYPNYHDETYANWYIQ